MGQVQRPVEAFHIARKQAGQSFGHLPDTPLESIDHCGFAVQIHVPAGSRMQNQMGMSGYQAVLHDAVAVIGRLHELLLPRSAQGLPAAVLLQHNQVAARLRAGIVGEQVVGQAQSGDEIAAVYQPLPNRGVAGGIQHALRGDERQDTALTQHIHALDEEVIMDSLLREAAHLVSAAFESRIEHLHRAERDVRGHQVERTVIIAIDAMKRIGMDFIAGEEFAEDGARERVLLETDRFCRSSFPAERLGENSRSGTGIQHTLRRDVACAVNGIRNGPYENGRRIECRQYGTADAVHAAFVLFLVGTVFAHGLVQLPHQREQLPVAPSAFDVAVRSGRLQNAFETAETGVTG